MDKLIKKGQLGTPLYKEIHLQKDPGEERPSTIHDSTLWMPELYPKARMDATVQQLTNALSTYKPTPDQIAASTGIKHKMKWYDWIPSVITALPFVTAAAATAPEWGPATLTTVSNPTFWGELLKDTGTYISANAASRGLTGKDIGAHVNNTVGLEEDHPVGEFIGFGGTSILRRPLEKAGIATYKAVRGALQPEYALSQAMNQALWKPYISRVVGENGKIRLRLPGHTDTAPREIVLEPQGNNKFYVHVRTWDDVAGKVPANLTQRDIGYLYEALYDELPEGAEILFPKSGPGNYATRGTVAGLQRLTRDPRFSKGSQGTLQYLDKDGSIKEFTGTSFIKNASQQAQIQYIPNISNYNNAPYWTPITKDWTLHSADNIKVVETRNGVDILLYNNKNQHIGGLCLQDMGNGQFDVIMINSTYPGGSGPLYNAGIKYGQLKYGDQFKGIRSGDSLVFPEKTLNVTNKFPRVQVGNRGAHIYGQGNFQFGPVHLLTDQSSYYPQLSLPLIERHRPNLSIAERFGMPKAERGNLTQDQTEALQDLYQYISNGRYRQNFVVDPQDNFVWGNSSQGTPAYQFLRSHGITSRGSNAWMDIALQTDYGKGWLRYSPVLNAAHWTQKGFPEVPGMSWVPGEAKMMPYPNGTNSLILTPQSNEIGAQLANDLGNPNLPTTIPKEVMRNFWGNVTVFQRPGTYLSGDAGNAPLGNFLIRDYINNRKTGIFPILNQEGNIKSITRMGLSPDSYSSIIRQAGRNPAYELRWGEGFRNWNDSAIENKYIYDAWLKWKKGEISILEYKKIFDQWAKTIGGRPLEIQTILGKQYPIHPHPFLYRRKQGGKLNIKKNNL